MAKIMSEIIKKRLEVARMTSMQVRAIKYIQSLPSDKLISAVDYLRYLYEQDYPLDEFDYELAERADEDTGTETISFNELLNELGINTFKNCGK
jgi:hypothetical protein